VRIKSLVREGIAVTYERQGMSLVLIGEHTGRKWEELQVSLPTKIENAEASQIALDIETAFKELKYKYVITQGLKTLAKSEEVKS
jgi:hypothetical protein